MDRRCHSFAVWPDGEDGVYIIDASGSGVEFLPDIKTIDLTIKLLKSIKRKGQEYIDLHNYKVWQEWEEQMRAPCSSPKQERQLRPGFIYFAEKDGYVKIGRTSKTPSERIENLSSNLPVPMKLLHAIKSHDTDKHEKEFHVYFAKSRVKGEWFKLTVEDIEIIKEIGEL